MLCTYTIYIYFILIFFFKATATTEIYTILFVGSVRCVQETGTWGKILCNQQLTYFLNPQQQYFFQIFFVFNYICFQSRFTIKYTHSKKLAILKATDNKKVLSYKCKLVNGFEKIEQITQLITKIFGNVPEPEQPEKMEVEVQEQQTQQKKNQQKKKKKQSKKK
eukprot:TRINITY_DN7754_c0_g1_i1.p1 TRINITY_DN7754_c0_g1~~TRINITY_DN7754_c0_g1_i1.p1  ORF type:complete len:164 (+),score=37.45 TRINITY_DN7754_c0_g1_i1:52-543(+)